MSASDLRRSLREAEKTLNYEVSSTSAIDNYKEQLNYLTYVIEKAVRTVGTSASAPSDPECSKLETIDVEDYLEKEECALEELKSAKHQASARPKPSLRDAESRLVATLPEDAVAEPSYLSEFLHNHIIKTAPRQSRHPTQTLAFSDQDDLKRHLLIFEHAFVDVLWKRILRKHRRSDGPSGEGESSNAMEGLKKQVERVGTAIHIDVLEAQYREQVASTQSQHKALMTLVNKLEEQYCRLMCLEALQQKHRNNIDKISGTMTDSYEVLNSAKQNRGLMLSHLDKLRDERTGGHAQNSYQPPLPVRVLKMVDPGAELDPHLRHLQKNLVNFAAAINKAENNETSCRESLTKVFRGTKKVTEEELSRVCTLFEQINVSQQFKLKRLQRFKRKAFVYFYLQPEKFRKNAAQFCAKHSNKQQGLSTHH